MLTFLDAEFLVNMSASADVLAMAKVEVDLNAIPEGKNVSRPEQNKLRESIKQHQKSSNMAFSGHHQVAWQARLRPTPNPGRN
jgi:hypothetical protein